MQIKVVRFLTYTLNLEKGCGHPALVGRVIPLPFV